MYKVIYKISFLEMSLFVVIFALVSLFSVLITIGVYNYKSSLFSKITSTVISIVFVIISIISTYGIYIADNVYMEYKNGNYNSISGIVENYGKNEGNQNKYEFFNIGRIYFEYGDGFEWGYNMDKSNGYMLKNGDNLRIAYVFDEYENKNVIVKLEVLE